MTRGLSRLVLGLLVACGGDSTSPTPPPTNALPAGTVTRDAPGWVEYTIGDAPLIISAPHGGLLAPANVPDRDCTGCITGVDDNTLELARSVATQFQARTGKRVHLVVNLLRRSKLDANRDVAEATDGNAQVTGSWNFYHQSIDAASATIATTVGRGLLLDLHGHGHAIPRLELGYGISAASLRLGDQELGATSAIGVSSIARLAMVAIDRPGSVPLLRGPTSLGALFVRNGIPAVPSPSDPAPAVGDEYFTGGYTSVRHGSSGGGAVDAIQIESHKPGLRDTPAHVDMYAAVIVSSALEFLRVHYGWATSVVNAQAARSLQPRSPPP